MPGMSPATSHFVKRPSIIDVIVVVESLFIGSAPSDIHMVSLPSQVPTLLVRYSCILPGVPASMHAFMSASVQPGGSLNAGSPAVLADWAGSAIAIDPRIAARPTVATRTRASSLLRFIENSENQWV